MLQPDKHQKKLVLAIDDDPLITELIGTVANERGHKFIGCGSAEKACRIVEDQRPDLIFLDLYLPLRNGIELLEAIRRRLPNFDSPVVVLSSNNAKNTVDQMVGLGAADYLVKPITINTLMKRMDHWVEAIS